MLEFYVRAIVSNPNVSNTATVYLLNLEKKILLPIEMGINAANWIMDAQNKTQHPRPTAYNTTNRIIKTLGAKITKIIIYKKQGEIFYAYIQIKQGDKYFEIDTRPSDAITLALLQRKPIYVFSKVFEKVGIEITEELVNKWNQRKYS